MDQTLRAIVELRRDNAALQLRLFEQKAWIESLQETLYKLDQRAQGIFEVCLDQATRKTAADFQKTQETFDLLTSMLDKLAPPPARPMN